MCDLVRLHRRAERANLRPLDAWNFATFLTKLYLEYASKLRSLFSDEPSAEFTVQGKEHPKNISNTVENLQDETSWQVSSQQKRLSRGELEYRARKIDRPSRR